MLDFLMIAKRRKKGYDEIYPKFRLIRSNDLMTKGGDFYAIWDQEAGLWSTDENTAVRLIDQELNEYKEKHKDELLSVSYMWDTDSGGIDRFHKYVQKQLRNNYRGLNEKIVFSGGNAKKTDYASHILPYTMQDGSIDNYLKLMTTLYSDEERHKFEWAIGSIINGDSKKIQKFIVFYGAAGTGKSTVMNLIEKLFEGYTCNFVSSDLTSRSASFALEPFSNDPLVGIEQDGDLSHIESNTRLNSLVSHESMNVNEKFKKQYASRFKAFLFIGSNKPVKITDARSGLIRRLIDVSPTGNKLPTREYNKLVKGMEFELGAIAKHCLDIYEDDPHAYDGYISESMIGATNDFFNFISDNYLIFSKQDEMCLVQAWKLYNEWADDAKLGYSMKKTVFKEELKNYYKRYEERSGSKWNVYYDFDISKFESEKPETKHQPIEDWLIFKERHSLLDDFLKDCPAQEEQDDPDHPLKYPWVKCKTKLKDIDTSKVHYVKGPKNLVTIDFDKKNKKGEKDYKLNAELASKWPKTYAELSKSGSGIHLEYLYDGDISKIARYAEEDVEIKTFVGNASLRRKVTKCNDIPVATITSGLPMKEEVIKMVNETAIKSEQGLRRMIIRNLNKEIHADTTSSINFIKKILDDAYASGMGYDVSDMRNDILAFAAQSSHQANKCIATVTQMMFKSEEPSMPLEADKSSGYVIFDCEVFPNFFLICWKFLGEDKPIVDMINPKPEEVAEFLKLPIIGFNNYRYDNHVCYASRLGYSNSQIYGISKGIIKDKNKDCFFGEGYNVSETDIFEYSTEKKSLKKWEVDLGYPHKELDISFDEPLDPSLIDTVIQYCHNDVLATEVVFNATHDDFVAHEILADISGGSLNDTTNALTCKLLFGNDKKPQSKFNYRNLGEKADWTYEDATAYTLGLGPKPEGKPWFPGYVYAAGVSTYRDENGELEDGEKKKIGEGGYVYAEPGMYGGIKTQDVSSMHPSSIIAENLFGPYTKNYLELKQARVHIKHGDFDLAGQMFDGKLAKYLSDPKIADGLSYALKIAINAVYGLSSAPFPNMCKDPRNIDNIVAKRGALFMVDLKHFVQEQGFKVAHIKTDSIKIPDITDDMIDKIRKFGECYGYTFETEDEFEKLTLVNKSTYIAKDTNGKWHAKGIEFAEPYVFKTLGFTPMRIDKKDVGPELTIKDYYQTKQVKSPYVMYLKNGNNYEFVGKVSNFVPVKHGVAGGAELLKTGKIEGKWDAVTKCKGYLWMEAETFHLAYNDDVSLIDMGYFDDMAEDAKQDIMKFGDYDWFISDSSYIPPEYDFEGKPIYEETVPFDEAKNFTRKG